MKKLIFTLAVFLLGFLQIQAQNPYAALGIEEQVLHYDDTHEEVFGNDTLKTIGYAIYDRVNGLTSLFDLTDSLVAIQKIDPSKMARFLSVDPIAREYPWYSPYQFAGNKVIWAVDLDGLEEYFVSDGTYIGAGTDISCKEVRVVSTDIFNQVKGNVQSIHYMSERNPSTYKTIPMRAKFIVKGGEQDEVVSYEDTNMDIAYLLNQAHIIYGESAGKEADMLAHLLRNREIEFGKLIELKTKEPIGLNKDGSYKFLTSNNSELLKLSEKYGFSNYVVYGVHMPYSSKAVENYRLTLEQGAPQIDAGVENKNYKNFFLLKHDVSKLQKQLPISKTILKSVFDARLGITKDNYPNYEGWRGGKGKNTPVDEEKRVKSD